MKKFYVVLFLIAVTFCSNAQVTLTKAFNEPVVGDLYVKAGYDTVTAIPKTTGAGQLWNYSTLTPVNFTETSTYTTAASVPNASIFPAATLAENQGGSSYTMYKSTATNFEVQGINSNGAVVNFSNTGIFAVWPISFGYNNTDIAGGSTTTGSVTATINATINTNASGNGTVMLPGGVTINNVLQVIQTITVSQTSGTISNTFVQKQYDYYNSAQKFPVLSIQYNGGGFNAFVNKNVVAGISLNEMNNGFTVYPNPAKDVLTIAMSNNSNLPVSIAITNLVGQVVKTASLGSESNINSPINVSDLSKGVYLLNIKTGSFSSVKKIIID